VAALTRTNAIQVHSQVGETTAQAFHQDAQYMTQVTLTPIVRYGPASEEEAIMTMSPEQKKLHFDLGNIGLRAQATAAGLVQLCRELHQAGLLQEDALARIKSAIADEIILAAPRSAVTEGYRRYVCGRLDSIFAGNVKVGSADELAGTSKPAG
jgi:hypothetical protein